MKVENRVHPSDEQITGFQEGDTDTTYLHAELAQV